MHRPPTDSRRTARAYAMLALVTVLWAGNSIIGRAVRFDVPPITLGFGRWLLASVLLLPWSIPAVRRDWPVIGRYWPRLLLLGLVGIAAFNSLLYTGLHHSTATNAMLIQASVPAFVLVFNWLFFRDRSPRAQVLGVGLAGIGVAVIVFQGDPAQAAALHFAMGDLILLGSAVAWALYTALLRLRPPIAPVSFVGVTFAVGAVALAPFAWGEWHAGLRVNWSPAVFAAYTYVALFASLTAYFLFNAAAARVGAVAAGQATTALPVSGAVLSALILGEPLHIYHLLGMALILGGIAMGAIGLRKSPAGAPRAARLEDAP